MLRVDGQSMARPINRYLTRSRFIKFDDTVPDEDWDNNNPKIKYIKQGYHIEWANVREDIKRFFKVVPSYYPRLAYGLSALWLILTGHEIGRLLFIGAIAHDADSTVAAVTGATATITDPHTCSGSNRVLVGLAFEAGNGVSSFKYNGADLTLVQDVPGPNVYSNHMYLKIAPDTGANNLVYVNAANFGANYGWLVGVSFTGADQTTQPDNTSATGTSGTGVTSSTVSITTSTNNAMIVDIVMVTGGVAITPAGTQTLSEDGSNFYPSTVSGGVSWKQLASAGTTTMTWSWSGSKLYDSGAISIRPAAEPPPTGNFFMLYP